MYSLIMGPVDLEGRMGADRVFEHTVPELEAKFKVGGASEAVDFEALMELPALLMPETQNGDVEQVARVGNVVRLNRLGRDYEYTFIPNSNFGPIPTSAIERNAEELHITGKWEFNRTHWALKGVDLYQVLARQGLLASPERIEESRSSTLAARPTPSLFIGSSTEGRDVAYALHAGLDADLECTVWDQGVFSVGASSLSSLLEQTESVDFAALVLSPDDVVVNRGVIGATPRDNVIFELGLFMGALKSDRVFMLVPQGAGTKLPSDLAGITYLEYRSSRRDSNLEAALVPAVRKIRERARALGSRNLE